MSDGTVHNFIPRYVEPRKFARQRVDLEGFIPVEACIRLGSVVEAINELQATLSFDISDEGQFCMTGSVSANLDLLCQRCLEPFPRDTEVKLNLAVVWNEDGVKQLPGHYEPWIACEESADLYSIIEEELLLSLPAAAYHSADCVDASLFSAGPGDKAAETQSSGDKKKNPFQVLEQLKGSGKN